MPASDACGLVLTGATADDAIAFDQALVDYLNDKGDVFQSVKALSSRNPDFALAQIFKGYLLMSMGTLSTCKSVLSLCNALAGQREALTTREGLHIDALRALAQRDLKRACSIWDTILVSNPHDMLALRVQHFVLFECGEHVWMRDTCARAYGAWDESLAGYSHVLSMFAFGLEEAGDYRRAEALGRDAVARNPHDLWGIHAVAHVLEMEQRVEDGLQWLDHPVDAFDDHNALKHHVLWHKALYHLAKNDEKGVLDLYDRSIAVSAPGFYLDLENASSLLIRMQLDGIDVGDRWSDLVDFATAKIGDHGNIFSEPHYALVYGAAEASMKGSEHLQSLTDFSEGPDNPQGDLCKTVALPVCQAIADYFRGAYKVSVDGFLQSRYRWPELGGSHAQRDVFSQLLIAAANKAGDTALVNALTAEREALRPTAY